MKTAFRFVVLPGIAALAAVSTTAFAEDKSEALYEITHGS